jgi:hypothetical protein
LGVIKWVLFAALLAGLGGAVAGPLLHRVAARLSARE